MSWTDAQEKRVLRIERVLNQLQTAVDNLMSKAQMRQLLLVRQHEVDQLTQRIDTLEAQVTSLQNSVE